MLFGPLCLALVLPARQAQRSNSATVFEQAVQPFFSKNCYVCHNSELKSGGLDIESYKTVAAVRRHRDEWERIVQKLRSGEMPPKEMPRPDKAELETVARWIEQEIEQADRLAEPDPGRVTA